MTNKKLLYWAFFISTSASAQQIIYDGNNTPPDWEYDASLACIYTGQQNATIQLPDAQAITGLDFCAQDPICTLSNEILSCLDAYNGGIRSITYSTNGDPDPNPTPTPTPTPTPPSTSLTGLHPELEAVSTDTWQRIREYTEGPPFAVTAWSGGAGNRYYGFVYGGGHNDTDYNGLWRLDHSSLEFEEYIAAGSGPLSVHTYDGVTLHPSRNGVEFCTGGGSSFPLGDPLQTITCTHTTQAQWYTVYDGPPIYNSVGDFAMVADKSEPGVIWMYRGAVNSSAKGIYKFYRDTNRFELLTTVPHNFQMDEGWIEDCGEELLVGRNNVYRRYSKTGEFLGDDNLNGAEYSGRECVNGVLYESPDFYRFTYGRFYYIGEGLFGMIVPRENGWEFWVARLF